MRTIPWTSVVAVLLGGALACALVGPAQVPPDVPRFRIAYATFLGGPEGAPTYEEAREVIPDADGSVLFGAMVKSRDLPVSEGAFQKQYAGDDPSLGHPGLYGGDCYNYGQLASGLVDLVIEASMKTHDFMALGPVVEASGGIVTDWQGRAVGATSDGRIVAAGDRRVHEQALKLLGV